MDHLVCIGFSENLLGTFFNVLHAYSSEAAIFAELPMSCSIVKKTKSAPVMSAWTPCLAVDRYRDPSVQLIVLVSSLPVTGIVLEDSLADFLGGVHSLWACSGFSVPPFAPLLAHLHLLKVHPHT